jgi:hypothetical protein
MVRHLTFLKNSPETIFLSARFVIRYSNMNMYLPDRLILLFRSQTGINLSVLVFLNKIHNSVLTLTGVHLPLKIADTI